MRKNSKKTNTLSTNNELFVLSPVKNKPIEVTFTSPDLSSQGGLLLVNEYENQNGFLSKLSHCVEDSRCQSLVQHPYLLFLFPFSFSISNALNYLTVQLFAVLFFGSHPLFCGAEGLLVGAMGPRDSGQFLCI